MSASLRIEVLRRANRQIAEASAWWKTNRTKAPHAFREELTAAFDLLARQPNIGVKVAGFEGVRRIHLNRIHYYLYYRVSTQVVEIVALWHASRGGHPIL
ncbi:MAG TPA: type II toxin-antitoxin system RelE/ParE family toxin [Thermoanaerobaculia bacterium]|nr:type II toxin-antitoxin system RelE/ParE family toxin [Thermoanaerobaculia bacterium]